MADYIDGVFAVNMLVDFLLLLGTSRLGGYPTKAGRMLVSAALGAIYTRSCLLPGFHFLGNILWRCVSLIMMSLVAYGLKRNTVQRGAVFMLLNLALGGAVRIIGEGGRMGIICAAGVLCLLYFVGFREGIGNARYVPVELHYKGKRLCVTALCDTGNTLRDPITGRDVLVISADVAGKLTGLTQEQLQKPVESISALPGLRLIPYRSIDNNGGFLLALRLPEVKIGSWRGSTLVAFAPEGLDSSGTFQALTGGTL